MEHNGLAFPPAYVPHGKKLLYDGEEVDLDPICEELATFYALVPDDGPQVLCFDLTLLLCTPSTTRTASGVEVV